MRPGWWLVLGSLVLVSLSGCITAPEAHEVPSGLDAVPRPEGAGDRFLKQVAWPSHLTDGMYAIGEDEDEQPGDMKDDGLLVMQRRQTDRSFHERPWSTGFTLENVHGTPTNPICICDSEFVFYNDSGFAPVRPIRIKDSSWILVDNTTFYGAGIVLQDTHNITITRSTFIEASGFVQRSDDLHVIDTQWFGHGGLAYPYNHPPVLSECWPEYDSNHLCHSGGLGLFSGDRIRVEWNYFDTGGAVGGGISTRDVFIHHNTLYHGGGMITGEGDVEVSWNLVNGWGFSGLSIGGSDTAWIHNNSWILYTNIGGRVFDQSPAVWAAATSLAVVENNDFIGYGVAPGARAGSPAVITDNSHLVLDDNYWGTLHDPSIPEGNWIDSVRDGTYSIDRWYTEPVHDLHIRPLPWETGDVPYWVDRLREDAEDQLPP